MHSSLGRLPLATATRQLSTGADIDDRLTKKERIRERPGVAHEFLQRHRAVTLRVSAVAAMEYLEGFANKEAESATGFLKLFDLVVVDLLVAQKAGRIRRFLRKEGRLLADADILIASCAL